MSKSDPDPFARAVGTRISRFRRERGLTQKQLADKVGVERFVISHYEHGRYCPGILYLVRLAGALGVTADELLGSRQRDLSERLEALVLLLPLPHREPFRQMTLSFFRDHLPGPAAPESRPLRGIPPRRST